MLSKSCVKTQKSLFYSTLSLSINNIIREKQQQQLVCVCLYSLVHSQFLDCCYMSPFIFLLLSSPMSILFFLDRKKFVRFRRWAVCIGYPPLRLDSKREREMRPVSHNDRLVAWLLSPFSLRERKLPKG